MKFEECNKDPKFRQAFIENNIRLLKNIISGTNNAIRHNDDYASILEEMIDTLELNEKELEVLKKELCDLKENTLDLYKQINNFDIMINIYNKYIDKKKENNTLKLYNN